MTVKTLSKSNLELYSKQLLKKIQKNQWIPDIIIGIATGGIYISRPLWKEIEKNGWNGEYFEIKLSRPSTEKKKKLNIGKILKKLPYPILNILRNLEVMSFELTKPNTFDHSKENRVVFPLELEQNILKTKNILLIDDAIDTGSTILAIKNVIQKLNTKADVKVAVLTVTHKRPFLEPDFTLYRRVLLRCPWAVDYKGGDHV